MCIFTEPALGFARPKAAVVREALSSLHFTHLPSPPFLPFPFLPFPFFSLPLPLEVDPLNAARGFGEHCKLPNRVWGRAPAEIEFGAFYPYNMTFCGSNFTNVHKHEAPLGARPKAGASLASPKGLLCIFIVYV